MSIVLFDSESLSAAGWPSKRAKQTSVFIVMLILASGFLSCKSRSPELKATTGETVDQPLTNFSQEITSSVQELTVSPGGAFEVPVTIKNPTDVTWSSFGKYPIVVSYIWFDNGVMLPPESQRTLLPAKLLPGGSITLTVKGTAPQKGQKLLLRITLVQEGVEWFLTKGARSCDIPVVMKQ
jgi:hypothetical protein